VAHQSVASACAIAARIELFPLRMRERGPTYYFGAEVSTSYSACALQSSQDPS
jgi:hypothetical protein